MDRLPQIQIARGLAVVSVVMFHSYLAVRYLPDQFKVQIPFLYTHGFYGVSFFFAISGFIIAHVMSRPDATVGAFLVKRFFRIYPLYWIFVAIGIALMSLKSIDPLPLDAWTMAQNFLILPVDGNLYYQVGWSLEHEVVFYLIAALTVPAFGVSGLAAALGVLTVASLLYGGWAYNILSQHHAAFLAGVLVFMWRGRLAKVGVMLPLAFAVVFFGVATNGEPPLVLATACGLLLAALLNIKKPERFTPLIRLGDWSYSLYLCHWVVIILAHYLTLGIRPTLGIPISGWLAEPYRFAVIGVSVFCASLLYRTVEAWSIGLGTRTIRAWQLFRYSATSRVR